MKYFFYQFCWTAIASYISKNIISDNNILREENIFLSKDGHKGRDCRPLDSSTVSVVGRIISLEKLLASEKLLSYLSKRMFTFLMK